MATRTPARGRNGRFKKGGSRSKSTTRRKSAPKRSTRASRKTPRRRRKSSPRSESPTTFAKKLLGGLRKDFLVYIAAIFLMAVGAAARPLNSAILPGKAKNDWTAWLISVALSGGGAYMLGKFAPNKYLSPEQARKAALLAIVGLTFYATIRPLLAKVPGLSHVADAGEQLGKKIAPKNQQAFSTVKKLTPRTSSDGDGIPNTISVQANPPFSPNQGIAGIGDGSFQERMLRLAG